MRMKPVGRIYIINAKTAKTKTINENDAYLCKYKYINESYKLNKSKYCLVQDYLLHIMIIVYVAR
jgi:hypothetical protein